MALKASVCVHLFIIHAFMYKYSFIVYVLSVFDAGHRAGCTVVNNNQTWGVSLCTKQGESQFQDTCKISVNDVCRFVLKQKRGKTKPKQNTNTQRNWKSRRASKECVLLLPTTTIGVFLAHTLLYLTVLKLPGVEDLRLQI